jgi:predicted permease
MTELLTLMPALIGLAAGLGLRRLGLLTRRDGESVFKLVFYLFVPAVTFTSLSTVDLQPRFLLYPAAAVAMIAAGYVGARVTNRRLKLPPVQAAVLLSGCLAVNSSFQLPFVQLLYGAEGVASIAAFDVVNTVATFTISYLAAARGNPTHAGGPVPIDRLVRNPALYAIAAGLLVNFSGVPVPAVLAAPVATVGAVTSVLIPVGIGLLFDPAGKGLRLPAAMVGTRMVTAVVVACAFAFLPGLSGVDRTVLLLLGVAPMVFASVAFASLEELDVDLATKALSVSLVVSMGVSLLVISVSA